MVDTALPEAPNKGMDAANHTRRHKSAISVVVLLACGLSLWLTWRDGGTGLFVPVLISTCAALNLAAAAVIVFGSRGGPLLLTRRRWKYWMIAGMVAITVVTVPAIVEGAGAGALFPLLVAQSFMQLFENEKEAIAERPRFTPEHQRTWKRIRTGFLIAGAAVSAVSLLLMAFRDVSYVAVLPVGFVLLALAVAVHLMLRTDLARGDGVQVSPGTEP